MNTGGSAGFLLEEADNRLLESVLNVTREILDCVRADRFSDVEELFARRMVLIEEMKQSCMKDQRPEWHEANRERVRHLMETNRTIASELEGKKKRVAEKLKTLRQRKSLEQYSQ